MFPLSDHAGKGIPPCLPNLHINMTACERGDWHSNMCVQFHSDLIALIGKCVKSFHERYFCTMMKLNGKISLSSVIGNWAKRQVAGLDDEIKTIQEIVRFW